MTPLYTTRSMRPSKHPAYMTSFCCTWLEAMVSIPRECTERDWSEPLSQKQGVVQVIREIYEHPRKHWDTYEMCEKLVDVKEYFQLWRFRHMKTVERIIGFRPGTGAHPAWAF